MNPSSLGDMEYPEFLEHFGVKGMKWGRRKNKPNISDLSDDYLKSRNNRAQLEETYKKNTTPKKTKTVYTPAKKLSDADLQARINRMNMEKQYAELTKGDRELQSAGRKLIFDVMTGVAQTLITDLLKTGAKSAWNSGRTTRVVQYTPALTTGTKAIGR